METEKTCGFEDLRLNDRGRYQCRVCGEEMPADFLAEIRLFSPEAAERLEKLEAEQPDA